MRDIPLIFLQNTPPDDEFLSAHGNDGITVKARAQMMAAVACSQVQHISSLLFVVSVFLTSIKHIKIQTSMEFIT